MKTQKQNSIRINNGMLMILGIILSGSLFLQSCSKENEVKPGMASMSAPMLASARQAGDFINIVHAGCETGDCAKYSVRIEQSEDGSEKAAVLYNGIKNVGTEGEVRWAVEVQLLDNMLTAFKEAGFYDMEEFYDGTKELTATEVKDGDNYKVVKGFRSAIPQELFDLQQKLESVLGIESLVSGEPPQTATNFISILHAGCRTGDCAEYSVKIEELASAPAKALITYEGIRNVKTEGILKWTEEIALLNEFLKIAEEAGFFDMKDFYDGKKELTATEINYGDRSKGVKAYRTAAPEELIRLHEDLESKLGISVLVNGE